MTWWQGCIVFLILISIQFSIIRYFSLKFEKKDRVRFEKWAFGDNFDQKTFIPDIPERWNKHHPECIINPGEKIKESLEKMHDLWIAHEKLEKI